MKVLIADDSHLVCERLTTLLSEIQTVDGIVQAGTVPQAIEAAQTTQPDVVILDIKMPGGSGIEVLMNLKKQPHPPKVIMFTQYPYPQFRHRCEFFGADYFLDKSTEFEKIETVIRQLGGTQN